MSESKPPKRKRILLINRDFQLRYVKAATGVGILSTFLTAVVILYPLYTFEILRIPKFLPLPILVAMALAAIVNISFIAGLGILITHKIAGPMYSMVRQFRRIGMGRYVSQMRLREEDELKFVVRNFNEMIGNLLNITQNDLSVINNALSELRTADSDVKGVVAALKIMEELEESLQSRTKG